MSNQAQRILAERKQKIDDAAKIAFAEAIEQAEDTCEASARSLKNQYREYFGEPFTKIINDRGLGR